MILPTYLDATLIVLELESSPPPRPASLYPPPPPPPPPQRASTEFRGTCSRGAPPSNQFTAPSLDMEFTVAFRPKWSDWLSFWFQEPLPHPRLPLDTWRAGRSPWSQSSKSSSLLGRPLPYPALTPRPPPPREPKPPTEEPALPFEIKSLPLPKPIDLCRFWFNAKHCPSSKSSQFSPMSIYLLNTRHSTLSTWKKDHLPRWQSTWCGKSSWKVDPAWTIGVKSKNATYIGINLLELCSDLNGTYLLEIDLHELFLKIITSSRVR